MYNGLQDESTMHWTITQKPSTTSNKDYR